MLGFQRYKGVIANPVGMFAKNEEALPAPNYEKYRVYLTSETRDETGKGCGVVRDQALPASD